MKMKFSLFLNLLLINYLVNCDTLKSLFVVHRHGDRMNIF